MAEAFLNAEGEFPISVLEDIKYNTPGTYKYYARQTNEDGNGWKYDHNTYEIVVEVTINNERIEADIISDDIIFTNNYSVSPTTVVLGGLVKIQDNNLGISLNNFVFELKNEDGEIISTVNAMDDGMIAFDEIRFELPGTYNYTISQVDTKIENVIYDLHVENVTITVTDNSMGSLDVNINNLSIVFENKYNQSTE